MAGRDFTGFHKNAALVGEQGDLDTEIALFDYQPVAPRF